MTRSTIARKRRLPRRYLGVGVLGPELDALAERLHQTLGRAIR